MASRFFMFVFVSAFLPTLDSLARVSGRLLALAYLPTLAPSHVSGRSAARHPVLVAPRNSLWRTGYRTTDASTDTCLADTSPTQSPHPSASSISAITPSLPAPEVSAVAPSYSAKSAVSACRRPPRPRQLSDASKRPDGHTSVAKCANAEAKGETRQWQGAGVTTRGKMRGREEASLRCRGLGEHSQADTGLLGLYEGMVVETPWRWEGWGYRTAEKCVGGGVVGRWGATLQKHPAEPSVRYPVLQSEYRGATRTGCRAGGRPLRGARVSV